MAIQIFIRFFICFLVNFGLLYVYKVHLGKPLGILEALIIVINGNIICFAGFSVTKNPKQFFKALSERLLRPPTIIFGSAMY